MNSFKSNNIWVQAATDALRRALNNASEKEWLPDPANFRLSLLSRGAYHLNYKLVSDRSTSILRVPNQCQWGRTPEDQIKYEYDVLRSVQRLNISPTPVDLVLDALPFMVESYIEGTPFRYESHWQAGARTLASLHNLTPTEKQLNKFGVHCGDTLIRDGLSRLNSVDGIGLSKSIDILRSFSSSLHTSDCSKKISFLHWDPSANNMLVHFNKCWLVDWEGARIGPPELDLAYFTSPIAPMLASHDAGELSKYTRNSILMAYCDHTGADLDAVKTKVDQYAALWVFRTLCWCLNYFLSSDGISHPLREKLQILTSPDLIYSLLQLEAWEK